MTVNSKESCFLFVFLNKIHVIEIEPSFSALVYNSYRCVAYDLLLIVHEHQMTQDSQNYLSDSYTILH
jgi:hypothetical protein